ncbi:MAG: TatD family deoxyribonuclease [Ruminococcaceae bacterium]|nr:TatD family deoxyribonuclease [Oscillospiraceae bacterium]
MLFDTHTHLDDERFNEDRDQVIEKVYASGVTLAVNIGADMASSKESVALSEKYDFIYAAVGVHPHEVETLTEADMETLKQLAALEKVVAIGEIGLDYYYDNAPRELQKKWFLRQLELARELDLPYIIHDRDAHADTMEMIKRVGYHRGVLHCYSGSAEMARELLDMGFYISFAGPLTFKNGKRAREVAEIVPMERLLIETDSPYLTPEPHRGERNDSSLVRFVCEKLAEIKGISVEEAARITYENGKQFFGIQ